MNMNRSGGRRTAVIVAVNPMPRLYIEGLARQLGVSHDVKVLTFYRSNLFDVALAARLVAAGVELHQFQYRGRLDEFLQLRRSGTLLRQWISSGDVDAFHCQPNHFLTNFLSFRCALDSRVGVHLIPDGVANFYLTKTGPYRRSMRAKALIGPLVGLPFRPYDGNYLALGLAPYDSYWYFSNSGTMSHYLPVVEFPAPERPACDDRLSNVLFLGQPPSGHPEFGALYQSILNRVLLRSANAHYKPHPAEHLDAKRRESLESSGFTILETDQPAETLASCYEAVAGIASSVLFNVRLLGWNDVAYYVDDPAQLEILLGRCREEIAEIVSAAAAVGLTAL